MKIDIEQIELMAKVILEAKEIAKQASHEEDGGTCNHDTPLLDLTGWKSNQVDVLRVKVPGIIGTKITSGLFKGCYFLDMDLLGQGNRRSRMAELAHKHMKQNELPVRMYYQAD
jgi:hypothetical protein